MHTPYSEARFIELITNNQPSCTHIDPKEVIQAYQPIFDFLERQAGTFSFIYDFFNFRYILVSKSIRSVIGQPEEILLEGGFQRSLDYFHPEDRENVGLVHQELFGYLHSQPVEDLTKLRFDFNYRVINNQGHYIKLLQQSVFTTVFEGKPLYDFSTCTDVTLHKRNNRMELSIYKLDDSNVYNLVHHYVVPATIGYGLSTTEFNILRLTSEGLSSKQVAGKCNRSLHTINNQRRSILQKTHSATIAEAIMKMDL